MDDTVTQEILDKYLDLERKIQEQEAKVNERELNSKTLQLKDLDMTIQQMKQYHKQAQDVTKKEKKDVDKMKMADVKSHFTSEDQYNSELSREQEEYLDALNKEEVIAREVEGLAKQSEGLQKTTRDLQGEMDKLNKLYQQEDQLLDKIFGGAYGSPEENKLEEQMDIIADKKNRIQAAHTKWTGARLLIAHAQDQLKNAVDKWDTLKNNTAQAQEHYVKATETRNFLIAATQNLTNANKYLDTVKFPFCNLQEVTTLERAITHVYTDMRTPDRHKHARTCYDVTYKRSVALLGWFDSVINNTIKKDLEAIVVENNKATKALRAERVRLIKAKIDGTDASQQDTAEANFDPGQAESGQDKGAIVIPADETEVSTDTPSPSTKVSSRDLPPPPTQEELFGQVDSLKKQHEREKEEYEKAQNVNKARMQQGLEEKLRERAARRNRDERKSVVV